MTYIVRFYHRDEYETDQELFYSDAGGECVADALKRADMAYLQAGHDFSLINRITIDME